MYIALKRSVQSHFAVRCTSVYLMKSETEREREEKTTQFNEILFPWFVLKI